MSDAELYAYAARIQALHDPASLAAWVNPLYQVRPHHRLIGDRLARLLRPGGKRKIMIFAPPRTGKSELVTKQLPLWWLAHHPHHQVVAAAYGSDLAKTWGRDVRRLVREHGAELGLAISPEQRTAQAWRLVSGGGMRTVGVGSGLTGHDADLLICDDPHKDREEAESKTFRDAVDDWWSSTFLTRGSPGTPICLIMCIVAGMRVLTGEGRWKPIEECKPGDTVVSLGEDRRSTTTAKITGMRFSGYDDTYTIKTARHELKVNGDHPFAVLDRSKFRPSAFKKENIEWVKARDLKPGDRVITVKSLPDDHVPVDQLPDGTDVTADLAWLLGFMLGDGWVTAHKRKNQQGNPTSYAVCIAAGTSKLPEKTELPAKVQRLLKAWSPNKVYMTSGAYLRTDWNDGGRLLVELGYSVGAKNKRVPDCVWTWSSDRRRDFLEGYVHADGYKQKANWSRAWRAVSANKDLLDDIHDLALTCGVRPTSVFSDKERTYQPPNSPKPITSRQHSLGLTFIPDDAEVVSMLCDGRHPDPQHLRYERITAIESGPALPVYDLSVEGTETFCAEGFFVHNTRWHPDDIAGRLLAREGHEWDVIRLPAIAVDTNDPLGRAIGEPLGHPKIPHEDQNALLAHWGSLQSSLSKRDWFALFQCDPQPAEGALLTLEQIEASRHRAGEALPEPMRVAVAVDPSGTAGGDEAGIVAGFLGADGRCYINRDASRQASPTEWAREVALMSYELTADVIFVETNFGGEMCKLQIQAAWSDLEEDGAIPPDMPIPRIEEVRAKYGKRIRAEPVAQYWVQGDICLVGEHDKLIKQWTTWQPGSRESPGRIDATVYLAQGLLKGTQLGRTEIIEPPIGISIMADPGDWQTTDLL